MFIPLLLSTVLITMPVHSEYRSAHSSEALDRKGFETSLYKGEWYAPQWWQVRKCIMHRESRYHYGARNKTSSAQGAYQFLDNKWRDSLVYMMIDESKNTGDGLENTARSLRSKPIAKWSRYWQDRAFYTAWQHGEGKAHWYHGGTKCF